MGGIFFVSLILEFLFDHKKLSRRVRKKISGGRRLNGGIIEERDKIIYVFHFLKCSQCKWFGLEKNNKSEIIDCNITKTATDIVYVGINAL